MIPVIDVFAGPGGLNEGFSRVVNAAGDPVFSIKGSFEMEARAIETLRLRAAYRLFGETPRGLEMYKKFMLGGGVDLEAEFPVEFAEAGRHVHQIQLGEQTRLESDELILKAVGEDPFVLVGGPPCQAYSLVGRARRRNDAKFHEDEKHFLFQEYLHILERFEPLIFVMENVKGLLSATHSGFGMFERIKEDLELEGTYRIHSLVVEDDDPEPQDFVIRSEEYGVPQRRHRVILLGVHESLGDVRPTPLRKRAETVRFWEVLGDLPSLRSSLTKGDTEAAWQLAREVGLKTAQGKLSGERRAGLPDRSARSSDAEMLRDWLKIGSFPLAQHSSRRHMPDDVKRYAYYAAFLEHNQLRPRVDELPQGLHPNHKNINGRTTPFADRFWVQSWDEPSSTIVAHLSKDGHHFIHPDKSQARSLTVREAARLQTFPDDYWFCGPRTAQFQQVGNAVPPYLAHQIGAAVASLWGQRTQTLNDSARMSA
ncbi:DNA cytosine methyltransferase [Propionibacteriaceae bacterium Y1923]